MTEPKAQPASPNAEDLARRAQGGSSACFASLVEMFQARLFNFLLTRTRSRADAEDLTQETFVRAWQKIGSYRPDMRFSTWLFTIGSRLASNHRRDSRRAAGTLQSEPAVQLDPSRSAEALEERRRIWSLVDRVLTEPQRSAVYLRYVEGLEPAEIALIMGKTGLGTRVMLFRARDRLAQALASPAEDDAPEPGPAGSLGCSQQFGGVS